MRTLHAKIGKKLFAYKCFAFPPNAFIKMPALEKTIGDLLKGD